MTPVKVREAGRIRKRSTQESMLLLLREKALQGDVRSLDSLLGMAMRYNNDPLEPATAQALAPDDQAILDAYVTERINAGAYSQLTNSQKPFAQKRRGRPRAKKE
jgi:hypothetical protein